MLKWQASYSIGIDLIDTQHKHLFEIGNSVLELIQNCSVKDKSEKVFLLVRDLIQYTKFHFLSEESYMQKINFPLYSSHKAEHDAFIKKINEIDLNSISINQNTYIEDLTNFLLKWIINHVLERDKLIAKAII